MDLSEISNKIHIDHLTDSELIEMITSGEIFLKNIEVHRIVGDFAVVLTNFNLERFISLNREVEINKIIDK